MDNNGPQWVNVRVRGRLEPPPIAEFAAEFVSAKKIRLAKVAAEFYPPKKYRYSNDKVKSTRTPISDQHVI